MLTSGFYGGVGLSPLTWAKSQYIQEKSYKVKEYKKWLPEWGKSEIENKFISIYIFHQD